MSYCPDNYDLYTAHEARQQRELERLPVCSECDNPIQTEKFFLINDEFICPQCLIDNYRKDTEDYIE